MLNVPCAESRKLPPRGKSENKLYLPLPRPCLPLVKMITVFWEAFSFIYRGEQCVTGGRESTARSRQPGVDCIGSWSS